MRYVDEFRDPRLIRQAADEITRLADPGRHYRIMEVRSAIRTPSIDSGSRGCCPPTSSSSTAPGCLGLCVAHGTHRRRPSRWTGRPEVIFTAFGDVMRVPGRNGSPLQHLARGAAIRMVLFALDALKLAIAQPDRHVVFSPSASRLPPSTALTLLEQARGVENFFGLLQPCHHQSRAWRAILDSPDMRLDAFIGPGHVSTVIGCRPYEFIAKDYGLPIVVSGFEPLDILQSIVMILRQLRAGRAEVENQYGRVVPHEGNLPALRAMAEVFELRPYFEWRGLGFISQSALKLRPELSAWDAEVRFEMPGVRVTDPKAAQCGEVLKGVLKPHQCKLFARECTPEEPVGALMVSSEGACAAYFNYVHRKTLAASA